MVRIAKEAGTTKPSVIAAVKALQEKGVLSVRVDGQRFIYRLTMFVETGKESTPKQY